MGKPLITIIFIFISEETSTYEIIKPTSVNGNNMIQNEGS
jgi:hypothetical protein